MIAGDATMRLLQRPIQHLLDNSRITEIVINTPGTVGRELNGQWEFAPVPEMDFDRLDAMAIRAARMTHRECDTAHPLCGSTLPDGQRIQIIRPPATHDGVIAMCIRKPPKQARTLNDPDMPALFAAANTGRTQSRATTDLLLNLYDHQDWPEFVRVAARSRLNIGAVGTTGSGKSDVLRRALGGVPETDRVVTVESDPEFGDVGPRNRVALFYDEESENRKAVDVIKACLRMYPKTIAFQEVRGAEAFALIRAILSGHNSFTSWHGDYGEEIPALAMMLRQHDACRQMAEEQLTALVRRCFDIIIWCNRGTKFEIGRVWFRAAEEREAP